MTATDTLVNDRKSMKRHDEGKSHHDFALFEHCPVSYVVTDEAFRIVQANFYARKMFGEKIDRQGTDGKRKYLTQFIAKESGRFQHWVDENYESTLIVPMNIEGVPKRTAIHHDVVQEGNSVRHHFVIIPVTQPSDRELTMYRMVYQRSGQAIYITDINRNIIAANLGFNELLGYREDQVVGSVDAMLYSNEQYQSLSEKVKAQTSEVFFWAGRVKIKNKLGENIVCNLNVSAVEGRQSDETSSVLVHILENITEQVKLEDKLKSAARRDDLTGLYNRSGFNSHYKEAFYEAQRNGDQLSLLFVDLDNFKQLNDLHGHDYGDILLEQAAKRMQACLNSHYLLARLGGDEFIILVSGDLRPASVGAIASKVVETLSEPFDIHDISYSCTASVGIASYPRDAITAEGLLKCADSAMYAAKKVSKNTYSFYDQELDAKFEFSSAIKQKVANALNERRIKPFYQSIQNMITGEIIGYECLVRLVEQDNVMSPAEFLPVISRDVLMVKLGKRLFSDVLHDLKAMEAFGISVPVSINLSAFQLRSDEMISYISKMVDQNPAMPSKVKIEITETMIFEEDDVVEKNVDTLIHLGFDLVLDDFGTGHSSIYTLKKFNFSSIKIDKNFVHDIGDDTKNTNLLTGIISLVNSLGVGLVCEGVENGEQQQFLIDAGCKFAQGYLYSKPAPLQVLLKSSFSP